MFVQDISCPHCDCREPLYHSVHVIANIQNLVSIKDYDGTQKQGIIVRKHQRLQNGLFKTELWNNSCSNSTKRRSARVIKTSKMSVTDFNPECFVLTLCVR